MLLAAVASGTALALSGDDEPASGLTVTWDATEEHTACVSHPEDRTVVVTLTIDGTPSAGQDDVTVTVTAYADENTSKPVGSRTRTVPVEGTVHRSLVLTIPVEKPPHVDEDGVAACRLEVE